MIRKTGKRRYRKNNSQKTIFAFLVIVYIAGIIAGCTFSFKNSRNIVFIRKVTLVSDSELIKNRAISDRLKLFLSRDILFVLSAFILKYSGLLKGLCVCIPFITAVQNSCVFLADYYNGNSISAIITGYGLRCTASAFLIIMYCTVMAVNILKKREDRREETKITAVYICGIVLIYIIDLSLKMMLI